MSLISISLRLNRRLIFVARSRECNLSKCHRRSVHLSSQLSDKDNSDKEKIAKEKLNQLLKDIKEAKAKRKDSEVKVTQNAKPMKRIADDEANTAGHQRERFKKVFQAKKDKDPAKTMEEVYLDPAVVRAANKIAQEKFKLEPNEDLKHAVMKRTESDLLKKLKGIANETDEAKQASEVSGESKNFISLFGDMKIEKRDGGDEVLSRNRDQTIKGRRAFSEEEKQFMEKRRKLRREQQSDEGDRQFPGILNIFQAEEPLGIFSPGAVEESLKSQLKPELPTYEKCRQREIRILSQPSPKNFLEEMVTWTDRGIMWHFPINNEQGIEEKDMEPFYQHVFLEPHLEPWCPARGPVRHFMEVICIGLSKNPHMSVAKKIEHINWFRDYFEKKDHQDILKLTGAI